MRRFFKWLLVTFSILLVVAVILVGIASHFFTQILNKQPIDIPVSFLKNHVGQASDRRLKVNGRIQLSFFPWLGLKAKNVQLTNTKSFVSDKPFFAEIGQVEMHIDLSTGISEFIKKRGHIEEGISELTFKDVTLYLEKNQQGQTNWSDFQNLTDAKKTLAQQPQAKVFLSEPTHSEPVQHIALPELNIVNANLFLDDKKAQKKINLRDLNVTLNPKKNSVKLKVMLEGLQLISSRDSRDRSIINRLEYAGVLKLPITSFDKLYSEGTLDIHDLSVNGFAANDLNTHLITHPNAIRLSQIKANVYQGRYTGDIVYSLRSDVPHIVLDQTFSDIQIAPLMKSFTTLSSFGLEGQANLKTHFVGQGKTADQILSTLKGDMQLSVKQGVLTGINFDYFIKLGEALLRKQALPNSPHTRNTQFEQLSGTATLEQGVISNRDFLLQTEMMRVLGAGTINIINKTIDYRLNAAKLDTITHQAGRDTIPLTVSGSFNQLNVRPDVQTLMKGELKKQTDRLKEKISEKISKSKLGEQLEKAVGKNVMDQIKQLQFPQ